MTTRVPSDRGAYTSVMQSRVSENHSNICNEEPTRPRRPPWARLGKTHLFLLVLGSIIILLALTALGLLWQESIRAANGAEPRMPWVRVLSQNWATSYVTICTALIRTTMAFQASLATAMLAGIILEMIGVPLLQGPYYSILRALDVAPHSLLSTTMLKPKGLFQSLIYAIVAIEVLVTIASQFLSTIFVSDFKDTTIANMNNSTVIPAVVPLGMPAEKWWSVPAASTWTFAEYSESASDGPTYDDTGHTYRAFLPFEMEAQRSNLRRYRGPALVMDQRVACARPYLLDLNYTTAGGDYLSGEVGMEPGSYPQERIEEGDMYAGAPITFTCGLDLSGDSQKPRSDQTTLCFIDETAALGNMSLKDPLFDSRLEEENPSAGAHDTLLLIDVIDRDALANLTADPDRGDGPWAIVTNRSGAEALRVTACITDFKAVVFEVGVRGSRARTEPAIPWDSQAAEYNTDAARRQLGASLSLDSLDDRGILGLDQRSTWQSTPHEINGSPNWVTFSTSRSAVSESDTNTNMAVHPSVTLSTDSISGTRPHGTHAAVFQDTLRGTKSPALAVQAALARIHQMGYYNALPSATAKEVASTSFSTSALIPTRWTGFIAATCLIAIHFIIMAAVSVMFLGYTTHSLLGNCWQAISQVVSEETLSIVERVDLMKDEEVESWSNSRLVDVEGCVILRRRTDGRVALCAEGPCSSPGNSRKQMEPSLAGTPEREISEPAGDQRDGEGWAGEGARSSR